MGFITRDNCKKGIMSLIDAAEKDEIVLVRFESDLIEALEAKKKIRFDLEVFDTLSLRDRSKSATVSKLLEAIIDYDAICPVLQFDSHRWTSKELKTLANLLTKSKAITKIVLTTSHNAVKTIFEALETNTSVKKINILEGAKVNLQIHRKFYDQLCQSLINSKINIDSFELENFTALGSVQHVDRLFDALKATKSTIPSLIFNSCLSIFEEKLNKFEELFIGNKQVTSLTIDTYFMPIRAAPAFKNIVKDNNIKRLLLKDFDPRLTDLMASFSENTSITDLDLNYTTMDPMELKDILVNNKTILKLDCAVETLAGEPIDNSIVDALEQNTSLTDLSINDARGIERALLKNNTLKRLQISDTHSPVNGDLFKKILLQKQNVNSA